MTYERVSIVSEKPVEAMLNVSDRMDIARRVMKEVLQKRGVTEAELTGQGTMNYIVQARVEFAYRCYRESGLGTTLIARLLNKDSATVRAQIKRAMKRKGMKNGNWVHVE